MLSRTATLTLGVYSDPKDRTLSWFHLPKAYMLRKSSPKLIPSGQVVLALSQEDPELSPSGEEINKNKLEKNKNKWKTSPHGPQLAPTPLLSECHLIFWLVCLSQIMRHIRNEPLCAERFCPDLATLGYCQLRQDKLGSELTYKEC